MATVSAPINKKITNDELIIQYNNIISLLNEGNIDGIPKKIMQINSILYELYGILIKYTMQLNNDDIKNFLNIIPLVEQNTKYSDTNSTLKEYYSLLLKNYNKTIIDIENHIGRNINGTFDDLQSDGKTTALIVKFYNTISTLSNELQNNGVDNNKNKIKNLSNISNIMKEIKENNNKINKNEQINKNKNLEYKINGGRNLLMISIKFIIIIVLIIFILFSLKKIIFG